MRKEQRAEKAIKYLRKRKSFEWIKQDKDIVIEDLQRIRGKGGSVHGSTFGFGLKLQKRFPKGFTWDELLLIAQKI